MLFVELALIRWTAANNFYLAYVTNFVLIASFLGIGIGFLRANARPALFPWSPLIFAALVAFVLAFPVKLTSLGGTKNPFQAAFGFSPLPRWQSLSITFVLCTTLMAAIGQGVGSVFVRLPPLDAYRLDIVGSIGGIVLFSLLSFLLLPPLGWGAIAAVTMAVLIGPRWQLLPLIAVVGLLALESFSKNDHWSPYYKVTATHMVGPIRVGGVTTHDVLSISANNIPHQTAYPVATLRRIERFYFFPYRHVARRRLGRVLIVGAGNGNDVAVALREGVRHVDAVEIDPVIQALGRRYHPDHPYQNPRVTVHIDDGRAYIERTKDHYDLILFALPDSLTLFAGQGNLRLENYLFTVESMRRVKHLLRPGGTFAMYNYYQPWLLDRYAGVLESVFGRSPCVELGDTLGTSRQAVLTTGAGADRNCRRHWRGDPLDPPTDDHPFPYLARRTIPGFYLRALGLILAATLLLIRSTGTRFRQMTPYLDLACMGAAFFLLETKNVVQFALLFGTTWFVNALVFTGVLLSVYAAVEVARHVRLPRPSRLYALLAGALLLAWVVPQESLLALDPPLRFCAAVSLAFAPIFFANLVFAQRFASVASSGTAFASNLLGAIIGGALEYLALITGYRSLLLVVATLYALAFLLGRRTLQTRTP